MKLNSTCKSRMINGRASADDDNVFTVEKLPPYNQNGISVDKAIGEEIRATYIQPMELYQNKTATTTFNRPSSICQYQISSSYLV